MGAACAPPPNTALPQATLPATSTYLTSHTAVISPERTLKLYQTSTYAPRSSSTPPLTSTNTDIQKPTPDSVSDWQVPVIDLHWAENGYQGVNRWNDMYSVILESRGDNVVILDVYSGDVVSEFTPTPDENVDNVSVSSNEYEVACSKDGLLMYHLPDRQRSYLSVIAAMYSGPAIRLPHPSSLMMEKFTCGGPMEQHRV
jgi:hypothetical protein